MVKNPPANARDTRNVGWIPGSGRSPGGGKSIPLQYSCLENPMDRGTWQVSSPCGRKESNTAEQLSTQGEHPANMQGRPGDAGTSRGTSKMPVKQWEVGRGLAHMFPRSPQKQQSGVHLRSLHIPAAVSSSVTLFPLILKSPPPPT